MNRLRFISHILIILCLLLGSQGTLFADTAYLAQRERAIEETLESFLYSQRTSPDIDATLAYLQAEAYYLYCQGMFADAIAAWERILLLDRNNDTAIYYIHQAEEKINATNKPKQVLAEEKLGMRSVREKALGATQGHYSHTNPSYNEIAPDYVMGENRFFDHSLSIMRNEQKYSIRTKRETTSIAHNIRADTSFGDYDSTFIASLLNDHSTRQDLRFPRHLYYHIDNGNMRFALGDNSTSLSRYVLNGMNYRGINFSMNTSESRYPIDRFKILYGVTKSYDTQSEEYYYPIEVFGVRNEIEISPRYQFGTSFAYQAHKDKITRVDALYRPLKNIVASFDQYIKLTDWWIIRQELAYSKVYDQTRNITVEERMPTVEDWAHYITSNMLKEKWQLFSVYEYGAPNFISLTGEARFLHSLVLNDKEVFDNTFIYTPTDMLLLELQHHYLRDNLHGEAGVETTKENLFSGILRIRPKNWLPALGFRASLLRARSIPGSSSISDKRYSRDFGVELTKTLYKVDWNLGYTYQKSIEELNNKFCDSYRNIYSLRSNFAVIPNRAYLNAFYSFADMDILLPGGDMTDSAHENKFDTSVSSRLWNTANLSLGYHYFNRRDYTGVFEDLDSHTASFVFSWPYTKDLFNNRKFTILPYLSYYYTKNDEYTDAYRTYLAGKIDASYYFAPQDKLSLMLEYKNGIDGSIFNQEGDEFRLLATYYSAYGL